MDDNLLAPLEQLETYKKEMEQEESIKLKPYDPKIPIPNPSYLLKESKLAGVKTNQPLTKYGKEYEEFCKWSALPKDLRKPKTATDWEKKHLMPKGYTQVFKTREDFRTKMLSYFWDWMMDIYPDVVYAVYQRAINKSSKDAGIFIDLLSKRMNLDKPRVQVQPMVLMGVPQEQIDKLFTPKSYDDPRLIPTK
ncbi:MAG: hypothetical protein AABY22_19970 [Nanoarchaeota archaeon]